MNRTIFAKSVARRSVLGGVAAGLAGMLIRPLQAQEALGTPKRLLIVHRPCGSVLQRFFPEIGDPKTFALPYILEPLAAFKQDLVILNGVTCPRDTSWLIDAHAAGLISMMSGKRGVPIPGTDSGGDPNFKAVVAPDKSIDQLLLEQPALQAAVPSIQSTAYQASTGPLPSFKVLSYGGFNQPLYPVFQPQAVFNTLFGDRPWPSVDEAAFLAESQSVLDCVRADVKRLQNLVPSSQRYKLEAQLSAIGDLEASLGASTPKACSPPTQLELPVTPDGVTDGEAQHLTLSRNHLSLIKTAFECDLSRVATFSFAHGLSDLRFMKIAAGMTKGDGHHGISHDSSATDDQARIEQLYCEQLALFLQQMKAVKEENGSLLDNTLIVYLNECAVGTTHAIENMPLLMMGGKNMGLQTGQHLNFNGRYMNDVWAAVCGAFGADAKFGDPAFSMDPVSGLFA